MIGERIKSFFKSLFSLKSFTLGFLIAALGCGLAWFFNYFPQNSSYAPEKTDIKVEWAPQQATKEPKPSLKEASLPSRPSNEDKETKKTQEKRLPQQKNTPAVPPSQSLEESPPKKEEGQTLSPKVDKTPEPQAEAKGGNTSKKPKISLILHGLGLNEEECGKASRDLDPAITLSYLPYGEEVEKYIFEAKSKGHEILMGIPMETNHYPQHDPGPQTLLTGLPLKENIARLQWSLSKAKDCIGVCNYMGSRFTVVKEDLKPILAEIHRQGFLFVDAKAANRSQAPDICVEINLNHARADVVIELGDSYEIFIDKLEKLIEIATQSNSAVGIIEGSPHRIDQLIEWQKSMSEEEFQLVPLSEVVLALEGAEVPKTSLSKPESIKSIKENKPKKEKSSPSSTKPTPSKKQKNNKNTPTGKGANNESDSGR